MKTENILNEINLIIEQRIAARVIEVESAGYEVDPWELDEIRAATYAEFGWEFEEETEEEEPFEDPNSQLEYSILSGRAFM